MRTLFLLLVFIVPLTLFGATESDSLLMRLSHAKGEKKIQLLMDISELYASNDSAKSLAYIHQAYHEATAKKYPARAAATLVSEADVYFNFSEYRKAIVFYTKAIEEFLKCKQPGKLGELYNDIGLSYYYLGEYEKAIESQIEAVKVFEQNGNEADLARIYINMGMVYNQLNDVGSSLEYYRKASVIAAKIKNPDRLGNSYNGMGTAFYNDEQLDSAKVYYQKALSYFKQSGNRERTAAAINNLANIYLNQKDSLEICLAYYHQAYSIYEELGNQRNRVYVMEGMGGAYSLIGNQRKALEILMDGLNKALENKYGYYIIQLFYQDISIVYERMKNTEAAFDAYKKYKQYGDSMRQEDRLYQAIAIEKKYEFTKSEATISKLNAEKDLAMVQIEKDKAFRNLGVFAILILLVIITYVSFGNYHRKRINRELTDKNIQIEAQKDELEQLNASKNKFFSIIAHDLKNPLHTVLGYSFLLHLEYDRFHDEERKKYAKDIYNSTNNIFRLLQNLLDWSRSQTGRLAYEPVIFELSILIEKISGLLKPAADEKHIVIRSEIPGNLHVYAMPMMIETVLRNIISNAIKFTPDGGSIYIKYRCYERVVSISVTDSGIGLNENELEQLFAIDSKIRKKGTRNEDGSGLGLILCKEFIELNKGKIWAESKVGKGSTFSFTVPLALE